MINKNEIKRLWDLGFGIHWLKPKGKMPVESGWTTGPRKDWDDLTKSFVGDLNVGVRLGKASLVCGKFLAVIDCDVKSQNPEHLKQMHKKLLEIHPGARACPRVMSGRGNGSMHIYILTDEPLNPYRAAQSADIVEVFMPSVKPSKNDIQKLGAQKIEKGLRLRPAWEISLMGSGQQVVLPPSIHPDSGKEYKWAQPFPDSPCESMFFSPTVHRAESAKNTPASEIKGFKFEPQDYDLNRLNLDPRDAALIREGENCPDDRSVGLFIAAQAMVKACLDDNLILSVLTDTDNFLSAVGFEHAKTSDRARAAYWVYRYTLKNAKEMVSIHNDFKVEPIEKWLEAKEAESQKTELLDRENNWRAFIERVDNKPEGKPKQSLKNVILILENDIGENIFCLNELSGFEEYGCDAPWEMKIGTNIRDIDLLEIKTYLANSFRFEPSTGLIAEAVAVISHKNKYHPIRDYLLSVQWDGTPRVDTWLRDYLNAAAPEPYLTDISRKVLVAMVARVFEPGTKFDQVLILEGVQGVGKSTALRYLASDDWFSDAHLNVADKDAVVNMRGTWLIELGELSALKKADIDLLKEFISRTTDKIRLPYGRKSECLPRQCVFIGTTNSSEYFKDTTGNRRFWPVNVGDCDFNAIKRDRDQLWAEAMFNYGMGENLYLTNIESQIQATEQQEDKMEYDAIIEVLGDFFDKQKLKPKNEQHLDVENGFTSTDLFSDFGPLANYKSDVHQMRRSSTTLKKLGFVRITKRVGDRFTKVWRKKR